MEEEGNMQSMGGGGGDGRMSTCVSSTIEREMRGLLMVEGRIIIFQKQEESKDTITLF